MTKVVTSGQMRSFKCIASLLKDTMKGNEREWDELSVVYNEHGTVTIPDVALKELLGHTDLKQGDMVYWFVDDGEVWFDIVPKEADRRSQ